MTPLLEEYFTTLERHQKELQNETVVLLMQVGSFYEAYEMDNPSRGSARVLSEALRMHLARKNGNKAVNDTNNPWMVGFPTYVLGKHLSKLNDDGFTVAVYEQSAGNKQERILKGIYNYTMRHEGDDEILSNVDRRIFGMVIDKYQHALGRVRTTRFLLTMVYVDMNSGHVYMQEQDSEDYHRELQYLLFHYSPPELLIHFSGDFLEEEKQTCLKNLENSSGSRLLPIESLLTNPIKMGILKEIYNQEDQEEDILVFLGLERHMAITDVLALVLMHIKKHDPVLVSKLSRPEFIMGNSRFMDFNRDVFLELNIASICERRRSFVAVKKQKTLLDIMGHGMTCMGRRALEGFLRRPLADKEEIRKRHEQIQYFQDKEEEFKETLSFPDLEWLLLKWKRNKLSYRLVGQFLQSIKDGYTRTKDVFPEFWSDQEGVESFLGTIEKWWDVDAMMQERLDFIRIRSFEMLEFEEKRENYTQVARKEEEKYKEYLKIQFHAENGYYLTGTLKKWEALQYCFTKLKKSCDLYEISKNKSTVRLSSEELDKASHRLLDLNSQKETYILKSFHSISNEILRDFGKELETIISHIAQLDCFLHLSRFFKKNLYSCPILLDENKSHKNSPQLVVQNLRHPIYEFIEKDSIFVPYSFELGQDKPMGMLLYGMNSSGKSTLLKSLGSAIWLSQAGLFVPATLFRHTIMENLLTKIGVYDNLFCGHSTFVAEMSELNYIFRRCSTKSLILCDELTAGTETRSATGIVVSALLRFIQQGLLFLFTTHLHTVAKIPEIGRHQKIRICHFKVTSHHSESFLIDDIKVRYDRELRDGPGDDVYGIEIARSLNMPQDFIARAFEFREKVDIFVHSENDQYRVSRYNKNLFMRECKKCGSRMNLHTHHITPQKNFSEKEWCHEKNGLYNLVVLCESCHQEVHHGGEDFKEEQLAQVQQV